MTNDKVTMTFERFNGGVEPPCVTKKTLCDALGYVIFYELGFGGVLVAETPTKVVFQTRGMSTLDTTIIDGSEEQIKLFVEASESFQLIEESEVEESLGRWFSSKMLAHAARIVAGSGYVRAACLLMLRSEDIDFITKASKLLPEDLMALVFMKRIDGATEEELKQLLS